MNQVIHTLAQLQRLRDKSVKEITVKLAQQKQLCIQYDNNIQMLELLVRKSTLNPTSSPSIEAFKNLSGYKGNLQRVIKWQEQEKTLARIKENRIKKNLVKAACDEKIIAMTLVEHRIASAQADNMKQQKSMDDIATQCWIRQHLKQN